MTDVSPETEALLGELTTAGFQIIATKSAFIALYAAVLYDHALTFSDEIKYIWKRRISAVTLLFFFTRYYALGTFTVVLASFFSPLFKPEVYVFSIICKKFATFFPFALGIPLTIAPGIIMGLRVLALYKRSRITQALVATYLFAELCVGLWIYSVPGGHPLPLPTMVHGDAFTLCTDLAADSLGNITSATFQFMETIYDTIIFFLVIYKTAQAARITSLRESITFLITTHSLIYFGVIFSSNLLWALMIIFAPTGLKYATAIPSIMLSNVMVNRLTIDLRSFFVVENATAMPTTDASIPMPPRQQRSRLTLKFTSPNHTALSTQFSTIGMGGEDYVDHHEPRDTKLQTISEQSGRTDSVDLEEFEMKRMKKDGLPGV